MESEFYAVLKIGNSSVGGYEEVRHFDSLIAMREWANIKKESFRGHYYIFGTIKGFRRRSDGDLSVTENGFTDNVFSVLGISAPEGDELLFWDNI